MKIVRAHEFGGPDTLVVDDIDLPQPGPGQVRVAVHSGLVALRLAYGFGL